MGLFDILALGAAHAAGSAAAEITRAKQRENEQERKKLETWNALFDQLTDAQWAFNSHIEKLEMGGFFDDFDLETTLDAGQAAVDAVIRQINEYRTKVDAYVAKGGMPEYVKDFHDIDQYTEKLEHLNRHNLSELQRMSVFQEDVDTLVDYVADLIASMAGALSGEDFGAMSGATFELECKSLIESMGFKTEVTKATGDGGIDLVAYDNRPISAGKYIVQCKRYKDTVGEPILRDLYGVVMAERANKGILITTGTFTRQAEAFAKGKQLELIDGNRFLQLLSQYGITGSTLPARSRLFNAGVRYRSLPECGNEDALVGSLRNAYVSLKELLNQVETWGVTDDLLKIFNLAETDMSLTQLLKYETVGYIDWIIRNHQPISNDEADFLCKATGESIHIEDIENLSALYPLSGSYEVPCIALVIQFVGSQLAGDETGEQALSFFEIVGVISTTVMDCDGKARSETSLEAMKSLFQSS